MAVKIWNRIPVLERDESLCVAPPGRSAHRHRSAVVALLVASVLWGTSFINVKICGEMLQAGASVGTSAAFGPLLLTAMRFTIAAAVLLAVWPETRRRRPRPGGMRLLLGVSVAMSAGFLLQAAGLAFTTATISAFIGSMCVCLTPILEWIFHVRRPSARLLLAVALATAAVALMVLDKSPVHTLGRFGFGELLTLACAAAYAFQILWTGRATEQLGAPRLTAGTFAFLALSGWACILIAWPAEVPGAIRAAAGQWRFWVSLAVVLACATFGAMILMNTFQRYVRPTAAAVIYTTEPVFAGLFAWAIRPDQEMFGVLGLAGAGMMILADLLAARRDGREDAGTKGQEAET